MACATRERSCTAGEVEVGGGCAAGHWPAPGTGCRPAGLPFEATVVGGALPGEGTVLPPAGVPPLVEIPPLGATRFCLDAVSQQPRLCGVGEQPCAAGQMPDPQEPSQCIAVGVPWICPPGFKATASPTAEDDLPDCVADPDDCGQDPFGGVAEAPGVLFVDASAAAGGDGSRQSPLQDLPAAVAQCVPGGTVAVAAGVYPGSVALKHPCNIIGRCAAKVTIVGDADKTAVLAWKSETVAWMQLRGLRLTGKGWGLNIKEPYKIKAERIWVDGVQERGVAAFGGHLELSDSLISQVQPAASAAGVGAMTGWGGTLHMHRVRVSRTVGVGVYAMHADTALTGNGLIVDHGDQGPGGKVDGAGVYVFNGGHVKLRSSRISRNHFTGILAAEPGSSLDALATVVDHGLANIGDKSAGHGISAESGAQVGLRGVRVHASHTTGVQVIDAGSVLQARGLLVDATRSAVSSGLMGFGLAAFQGGMLFADSVRLNDSRAAGLGMEAQGTTAVIARMLVDGTRAQAANGALGVGVAVESGAILDLRSAHVHGSSQTGINAVQPGTVVQATDIVVTDSGPQPGETGRGFGIAVGYGAHVAIRGGRVSNNTWAGVVVAGGALQTRVRLEDLLIDRTRFAASTDLWGLGLLVEGHADVQAVGCRVVSNRFAGIGAQWHIAGKGEVPKGPLRLRVHGAAIERTRRDPNDHSNGMGAVVVLGAQDVSFDASLFAGNHSAAVAVSGASAVVRDCALLDTGEASYPKVHPDGSTVQEDFSDGLLVHDAVSVRVERCLMYGHQRAGVLLDHNTDAQVSGIAAFNGLFGIAAIKNTQQTLQGNLLYGNGQNVVSDQTLFVPPAPTLQGL